MNKYGVDNFSFEILEETDRTSEREMYWIQKLNTYGKTGQNATLGGDGKTYLTLNEDEIIEFHINIAEYVLGKTAKHFAVDTKTIKKILLEHNIKWLNQKEVLELKQQEHGLSICMIDKNTDQVLMVFDSQKDAYRYFNKNIQSRGIRKALRDQNKTAFGYKWRYLKDIQS